jgi:hypothetical protein
VPKLDKLQQDFAYECTIIERSFNLVTIILSDEQVIMSAPKNIE